MRLAEAARARGGSPGPRCTVAVMLETLGDELAEAVDDESIPATAVEDEMRDRGYDLSEFSIRRHRRGRCRC